MWILTIRSVGSVPREHALKAGQTIIGRKAESDICIADDSASRRHAMIDYNADTKAYAVCCGVGAWQRCDPVSRQIRLGRSAEARVAGASILISPCSRCTLHFQCQACHDGTGAVNSGETKIMDLAVYVADRIAHRKVG